jgi:phage baseplate assembly protein W
MATSRAQTITQTLKKVDTYSDFTDNFIQHPITHELITIKNESDVGQAIKNVILTNVFERPFNPFFGSNIRRSLFEDFGPFVIEDITRYINMAVRQFEPRIQLLDVGITDDEDHNGMSINIVYSMLNNPEPVSISLFLRRVR